MAMKAKAKKKITKKRAKKPASKSTTWPQMHTRISASNQKFLRTAKKQTKTEIIDVLDAMIGSFRKSGVKSLGRIMNVA